MRSLSIFVRLTASLKSLRISFAKFSNAAAKSDNLKIKTMKVLNVAEKNDAAKNIAGLLSRGTSHRVRKQIKLLMYQHIIFLYTIQ